MKKAGECSESMKFCHSELQELSLALVRIADDPERDIRLEVILISWIICIFRNLRTDQYLKSAK